MRAQSQFLGMIMLHLCYLVGSLDIYVPLYEKRNM